MYYTLLSLGQIKQSCKEVRYEYDKKKDKNMVSEEMVKRLLNKLVHVDFFNEKTMQMEWIEGTFSEYEPDEEEGTSENSFVVIETETDLDRIPESSIRKIYLKEKNLP